MIQNHILNEILHRIAAAPERAIDVARQLGIDPDAEPASEPNELDKLSLSWLSNESAVLKGAVPFELKLNLHGSEHTAQCRLVFATTLYDDDGERIPGQTMTRYEVLDWRDHNHRVDNGDHVRLARPRWVHVDLSALIPDHVERELDMLMEREALALERAG